MKENPSPAAHDTTTIPFPAPRPASPGPAAGAEPNPAGRSPRGRKTTCAPRVLEMLKNFILEHGCSDTAAAEAFGISSTTISRWKKQDPEIACALLEARMGCRMHHLKKIERHSESDTMRGLRASIWILERLFPGDYAAKMSERFEYRTLEDQRKVREERALLDEDVKWRMEAEKEQREQAAAEWARAATSQPGAGAQVDGVPPEMPGDGKRNGEASIQAVENACASESDSRNSRNSGEPTGEEAECLEAHACQVKEPGRPRPTDSNREAAHSVTRNGDGADGYTEESAAAPTGTTGRGRPSTALRTSGPDSLNEAAPAENACIYSEGDSRNSRNSPAWPADPVRPEHGGPST